MKGNVGVPDLEFLWQPPTDWGAIAADWQALAKDAKPNIFLSWAWIETWANTYGRVVSVLRVFHGKQLVAMGLWARQKHVRPLGLNVQTLHLHHCGVERLDQIWPEYNELLCLPDYRHVVHGALLENIPSDLGVNEVDLGVCENQLSYLLVSPLDTKLMPKANAGVLESSSGASSLSPPPKRKSHWLREERWTSVAIQVPLQQWTSVDDYLASLSSSFRYQLRRAEKGLSKLGPLELVFAESSTHCSQWLMADAHWHQKQWGEQSGFNNPDFVKFHEAWVASAFDLSLCGYVRLMAGDTVAAGAYFFQDTSCIYFYLGFARNEWGPKVKTGFCLHLAMIRYCFEQGIPMYDFMGGDYDYKRRFGSCGPTLVKCRYKPNTLLNRAEQGLKRARSYWHKRSEKS